MTGIRVIDPPSCLIERTGEEILLGLLAELDSSYPAAFGEAMAQARHSLRVEIALQSELRGLPPPEGLDLDLVRVELRGTRLCVSAPRALVDRIDEHLGVLECRRCGGRFASPRAERSHRGGACDDAVAAVVHGG